MSFRGGAPPMVPRTVPGTVPHTVRGTVCGTVSEIVSDTPVYGRRGASPIPAKPCAATT